MRVKTMIEHANDHGDKRQKLPGDVYQHPEPSVLIGSGFVEVDAAPVRRRGRKAVRADD